ncbi:MAG: EamA family transporter [Elusimicrobiales bacterium]|nr:EamA family transporter [Elusimicrobiales bacterium]
MKAGVYYSLAASLLFAAGVPASKVLLAHTTPMLFAGLCYFASGAGVALLSLFSGGKHAEAPLCGRDWLWVCGSILAGGIIAPAILMTGIALSPHASSASILFTSEIVFTAALARALFGEHVSAKVWLAAALVTLGAAALSWKGGLAFGMDAGLWLVILACLIWGFDNNFVSKVSGRNPTALIVWKGLAAGAFNIALALWRGAQFPPATAFAGAMATGFVSYGLSLVFLIRAMRELGAARSAALFGTNPFVAATLSVVFLREPLSPGLAAAFALNAAAAFLLFSENHLHEHVHESFTHNHLHSHDEHHAHGHSPSDPQGEPHSHPHEHSPLTHNHPHSPDEHHRHGH